ncbi:hypothetical protein BO82DRAFT_2070 [Aspergillus uvarum CBS 121591]|uniref:Uncharacterized protein n=1 Tax=Aspergillus uvarum CBS 121591 TaxID=1448315 RepID=A0A319CPC5_9EURO|nr:hypothetical protein BO82DRAFT_2070 [Aspergillus uvarum CBS 121591]PYH87064.1 hypothetical protein BO82DRAFT_2070 [Aspergillus uvarum CBS 121591]
MIRFHDPALGRSFLMGNCYTLQALKLFSYAHPPGDGLYDFLQLPLTTTHYLTLTRQQRRLPRSNIPQSLCLLFRHPLLHCHPCFLISISISFFFFLSSFIFFLPSHSAASWFIFLRRNRVYFFWSP